MLGLEANAMLVRDLMQRRVTSVDASEQVGLAMQLMLWREIRHLPVMKGGRLVGILTERDLLRARASADMPLDTPVEAIMVAPVQHIHPNAEVADAAADMSTRNLGCLPVVDGGELVGILTRTDLLANAAQYELPGPSTTTKDDPGLCARDVMTPSPVAVTSDEPLVEAAAKMAGKGIRHLCVVDAEQRVVGMLSDRDLRSQIGESINVATANTEVASRRLGALSVSHAMTEGARTATLETPLADLVNIFLTEHIGAVPVIDAEDRLKGIVSYVDVLRAFAAGVA